ncbi:hypothetical protein [Pseudoxanthomonas dokdonensis]|uniref:Uncharacterized protein n=1 Tax=Pseudoxanthomonas dokdonensis TaxID=344882 RepID=A0A0R0D190_9GAMM|nr:hypothetical protein [Pseudoxanthomonas dokdonensis]KRG71144.1 hypothetical protein ABB29_04850 [Pseudoxanthomonas dokdonensis]
MERLNDNSRGVDDSYALFTRDDLSPFEAAYVITPLPEQMRDTDRVLQALVSMQQDNADGGKVSFIKADTPFGPGLEMIVAGRAGSTCFPTSHFVYATAEAPSIGISRFVVRDETLIEYSLVMGWPNGLDQDAMVKQAQQRMDAFQRGLVAEPGV